MSKFGKKKIKYNDKKRYILRKIMALKLSAVFRGNKEKFALELHRYFRTCKEAFYSDQ